MGWGTVLLILFLQVIRFSGYREMGKRQTALELQDERKRSKQKPAQVTATLPKLSPVVSTDSTPYNASDSEYVPRHDSGFDIPFH
jgi:hypothetical protein